MTGRAEVVRWPEEGQPPRGDLEGELRQIHPRSYGWALSCCAGDPAEAEEVLQTAYLKVMTAKARFDGRSSFKTWLFSVIRNTAAGRRRSGKRAAASLARWVLRRVAPAPPSDPESRLVSREASRILSAALAVLPTRQREVLHLVFYQDLTIEEAAAVLRVSVGTARVHYERAKKRLREVLPREARG